MSNDLLIILFHEISNHVPTSLFSYDYGGSVVREEEEQEKEEKEEKEEEEEEEEKEDEERG